ncbi:MAG TPA: hypothetical protein VF392_03410 [Terracidiphilus sp.]
MSEPAAIFERKPSSWHISVAAEGIAAAQFARCGFDVSVQYGADQPEYDLIVAKGDQLLKVSVKGSQDWGWGLTQSFLKQATKRSGTKADYHGAINLWLERHKKKTVICFVQFGGLSLSQMPRIYLATPHEVAIRLRATSKGRGDAILYERQEWTSRAHGAGTIDEIPQAWSFSERRIYELMESAETGILLETPSPIHRPY